MNLRSIVKGALLVTASAALVAFITMAGILAFIWYNSSGGKNWGVSVSQVSDSLTREGGGYAFTGEALLSEGNWALLLDESGQVVWSFQKPADLPNHYTLTQVASFTRWYLEDYPVQCWVREDGLLVVGSPRGSIWKHDMAMDTPTLLQTPFWFGGIFLLALGCVLALTYGLARRWFRQAQQVRDSARSDWINGVSHDIRTPLSVVMGYAAQLEDSPDLPPGCRRQVVIIRTQSQTIRDLVNDLNLTMRLDCAMQALRKQPVQLEPLLRQVAADFLNSGMADGFSLEMDLPAQPLPILNTDPFLLRRAVNNLLTNCVRHNAAGCAITLGAKRQGNQVVFWVSGGTGDSSFPSPSSYSPESDGGAAHGTGLRLVAQIAVAHGGQALFLGGTPFRCEIHLPIQK